MLDSRGNKNSESSLVSENKSSLPEGIPPPSTLIESEKDDGEDLVTKNNVTLEVNETN